MRLVCFQNKALIYRRHEGKSQSLEHKAPLEVDQYFIIGDLNIYSSLIHLKDCKISSYCDLLNFMIFMLGRQSTRPAGGQPKNI